MAITFSIISLYFVAKGKYELAILFQCYAIYAKQDTKD